MAEPQKDECSTCGKWRAFKSKGNSDFQSGTCRANAPAPIAMSPSYLKSDKNERYVEGVWPKTRDNDWCFQWSGLS